MMLGCREIAGYTAYTLPKIAGRGAAMTESELRLESERIWFAWKFTCSFRVQPLPDCSHSSILDASDDPFFDFRHDTKIAT